jgi:hypothetical protein
MFCAFSDQIQPGYVNAMRHIWTRTKLGSESGPRADKIQLFKNKTLVPYI